ncbi:MAG: GNAT family protein [Pseudomonadota bacterium]
MSPEVSQSTNDLGQPIGALVADWTPPPRPSRMTLIGQSCRLEPLSVEHAADLYAAHGHDTEGRNWTYLPAGPYETFEGYRDWVWEAAASPDPMHYTIITDKGPVGTASYLRIAPSAGSIEVGYITFSPLMQRTRASTEAMYLMMKWAFEAGYRRYEWKCNALNIPSRTAAMRLGLSYEGVFRQAQIVKGGNRDTAWYAAIDSEWPAIQAAMETWLADDNFDADGRQKQSLSDLTRPILVAEG